MAPTGISPVAIAERAMTSASFINSSGVRDEILRLQ